MCVYVCAVSLTEAVRAQRVLERGEGQRRGVRRGRVRRGGAQRPGGGVRGAGRGAVDALHARHQRRPPVHARRAVTLLPVVVVAPRPHLRRIVSTKKIYLNNLEFFNSMRQKICTISTSIPIRDLVNNS